MKKNSCLINSLYSFVSNGEWHKATIERTGRMAILTVEGEGHVVDKTEGFSGGSKSVLNLHQDLSKFYIGGVPDVAKVKVSVCISKYVNVEPFFLY